MAEDKSVYTVKINFDGIEAEAQRAGNALDNSIGNAANKVKRNLNVNLINTTKITSRLKGQFKSLVGFAGFAGITASAASAVRGITDFNLKMAEVNTLLKGNSKIAASTTEEIEKLAIQYGKDKTDLAAAYYDIISAGTKDAAGSVELLTAATKASVVGLTSTENATGAILSVLNAYGSENITATRAANQLFATVQEGRTNFNQLTPVIGDIVPLASQLGIEFGELGGLLAVSTRVSGSTAKSVTQLGGAFTNILKPSAEAEEVVKKLNKTLGTNIEFSGKALREKGFKQFFDELLSATSGFADQDKILSKLFGSQRALRGILSVTGRNYREVKSAIDAINEPQDKLNQGFEKIDTTLRQKFNKTLEQLKGTLTSVLTALTPLLKDLLDMTDTFSKRVQNIAEGGSIIKNIFGGGSALAESSAAAKQRIEMPGGFGDGVPFNMSDPTATDATSGLLDTIMGGITGEDGETPMAKFANDMNDAAVAAEELNKKAGNLKPTLLGTAEGGKTATDEIDNFKKSVNQMLNTTFSGGISKGIQSLTNALVAGGDGFKNFGKVVLNILGDMAIMMGNFFITSSKTMKAMMSNPLTFPFVGLAGGIALVALGALMKSFGSSAGASGAANTNTAMIGAASGAGITDNTLSDTDLEDELSPEAIERRQMVQLVVHGDVLDSQETGTRLLQILDDEFSNKGGRLVYT